MDKAQPVSQAVVRLAAMNLLARREHSTQELRRKLLARKLPQQLVEEALRGLQRDGLLSDRRFVEEYIRARAARGYGPLRILAELQQRGVSEAQIEGSLRIGDSSWGALTERVYRKQFGETMPVDYAERARRARYLHARGFTSGQIQAVLKGVVFEE